jgi:ubiquinone/menaquinone biosynthesis C-methylase UbiE
MSSQKNLNKSTDIISGNVHTDIFSYVIKMDSWNSIFKEKGKVFTTPHPDMPRIINYLKEKRAKRILDLGCGTGRHLVLFANEGFEIYGLDSAPEGIEIAKDWLAEKSLSCELIVHQMEEKFPYQDSFFDAVISIQAMHHNIIEKIKFTINEIERVLKPGGLLFITVPTFERFNRKNRWNLKKVEKGTFVPLLGPEKGLFHHFFTEREIYKVFNRFQIKEIYIDKTKHRAILGFRK